MIPLDPTLANRLEVLLHDVENFVRDQLVPAFVAARMDSETAAIVVPGWDGDPQAAEYQAAVVRSGAALEQYGLAAEDARRLSTRAMDFIVRNLWDEDHGGWIELAREVGEEKQTITQARVLTALAEFLMVSGDFEVAERVVETFKVVQVFCADNLSGGYRSRFARDWTIMDSDSNSGALPMLAEGFATTYLATGAEIYRRRALETVRLVTESVQYDPGLVLRVLEAVQGPAELAQAACKAIPPADPAHPILAVQQRLEVWRHTRQAHWLEQVMELVAGREPDPCSRGFSLPGAESINGAVPGVLRMEMLLLKVLYGSR